MAERDGDGVRRVVRLRHGLQGQDAAHHVHDLLFVRTAITDDRLLDLQRRVFIDLQPGLIAREQDDAAAMGNGDAGRDIRIEKQLLDRHHFRVKLRDEFIQVAVDLVEPAGQLRFGRRRDHAAGQQTLAALFRVQHCEADRGNAGVNAQDPHMHHSN